MALDCTPEYLRGPQPFFFFVTFREKVKRISLCIPHLLMPCLLTDQISRTIFEKGHPRNISVELFQNLTSGFREDFFRICSCLYSESSLHSLEPCLMMDQNFANNF